MKLIIDVPELTEDQLPGLAEATRHDHMMHRVRLEWLVPQAGGSRVFSHPVTSVEQEATP